MPPRGVTLHKNPNFRSVNHSWTAHYESTGSGDSKRYRYVVKDGSKIVKRGPWRKSSGDAFDAGRSVAVRHNLRMK